MLAVKGIYEKGKLILKEQVPFKEPAKVIVTFLDETKESTANIKLDSFSFAKSREILKNVKGSFSDALIEERRDE